MNEVFELPEDFTAQKREKLFQEILSLYDLATEVRDSVTRIDDTAHREKVMAIVTPYLIQMRCSTDIFAAIYNVVAFNGRPITRDLQDTCETACRDVFFAFDELLDSMQASLIPPDDIDPTATAVIETLALILPPLPHY